MKLRCMLLSSSTIIISPWWNDVHNELRPCNPEEGESLFTACRWRIIPALSGHRWARFVERRPGLTVPFSHVSPLFSSFVGERNEVWAEEMRLWCVCVGFFLGGVGGGGGGGGGLGRFVGAAKVWSRLRVTDIVGNEGSETRLRWRGAENLKKMIFFSWSFYLKKCDFKRSHGAMSALCVSTHTSQIVHFIFVWEKKRCYTRQSYINYISGIFFSTERIKLFLFCYHRILSIYIYFALNHL